MNYVTYDMDGPIGLRTMSENIHTISDVSISIYDPQFHLLIAVGSCDSAAQIEYWTKKVADLNRNSPNLRLMSDNMAEAATAVATDKKDLIAYAVISNFYFDAKANPHIRQFRDGLPLLDEIVIRSAINMIALSVKCCLRDLVMVDPDLRGKVENYIDNNLHRKITVRALSNALNVNTEVMVALFHEELKTTLPKYLHEKRLDQAKKLLEETDLSFDEISTRIGMAENPWTRLFKKHTSVTPEEYRMNSRKEARKKN